MSVDKRVSGRWSRRGWLIGTPLVAVLVGCRTPVQRSVTEIAGTRQERIHALSRRMTASARLRLIETVVDANLQVEQLGDGNLGPADYHTLGRIRVLPTDVVRWTAGPGRLSQAPAWTEAPKPVNWWVKSDAFAQMTFYESQPVLMEDGWIGVTAEGLLYFRTVTR